MDRVMGFDIDHTHTVSCVVQVGQPDSSEKWPILPTNPALVPTGQQFRPVSAQRQPQPPTNRQPSFGRYDSDAAPTAAAHLTALSALGLLRTTRVAPPLRHLDRYVLRMPNHFGSDPDPVTDNSDACMGRSEFAVFRKGVNSVLARV